MEEPIVFLDRLDEVASIRTKLEAVSAGYVGLVVPHDNHALHSAVSVRLIIRHADSYALRLCIISADGAVRRLFREEGIPVFRNVRAYKEYVASQSRPLNRLSRMLQGFRLQVDRTAGLIVLLIVIAVAAALAYALVPTATVAIAPQAEPLSDAIVIKADPAVKSLNVDGRLIPARKVDILLDGSIQVNATGRKPLPSAQAQGQVTLANRTAQPITIPGGTTVKTADNVLFVLQREITLPAGPSSSTKVDVLAVVAGPQGNVDRGKITKFDDPKLDQQVSVFNEEPTADGGARDIQVVSAEDKAKAKASLVEKLEADAKTRLKTQLRPEESLPDHSVTFTVLDEVYDKNEGDQARVLNLKISGRASGTIFDGHDVNDLVKRAFQPKMRAGYVLVPDAFKIYPPEVTKVENAVITFVVRVEGYAIAQINETRVLESLRWKTPSEAKTYLMQNLSLSREPSVTIDPGWASRALRVQLVIEGDWAKNKSP